MIAPRTLVLSALISLTTVAHAQQQPLITEHGIYGVHLIQRTIGTEEYSITDDGTRYQLAITTNTSDRGMKRSVTTTLDYLPTLSPTRLEQHSITPASATAPAVDNSSLTTITGNKVTVQEAETSRTFIKPAIAFTGFANMPAAAQMLMMRYWLHHGRPAKLSLLRASPDALPVEIRAVGHDAFTVHGEIIRLTRYTVANLIWGREVLWLNDSERVAAIMTFAGGLPQEEILDEYKSAFDPLFQSGVSQEMLTLAALTRAVRPIASGTFAITGARLINTGLSATPATAVTENATVLVRNGIIAAVGPASSVHIPPGTRILHANGESVLPGLWEMHVHYSGVEFGPALLAAGITTARDCGGEFAFLRAVRHAIEVQHQLGPRLLYAGLIDGTGTLSPTGQSPAFGLFTADTPAQATDLVDMYADTHFQQIKVYTQIQPDVLRAISAEAHKRGLTVTGHVPAAVDSFQGVADCMDQINHLQFVTRSMLPPGSKQPFTLADLNTTRAQDLIKLLAEKHIVVDPTLGWGEMASHPRSIPTSTLEPGVLAAPFPLAWRYNNIGVAGMDETKFHERMSTNLAVIKALSDAGVPVVAGSDTNLPGYGLDRELELYVQAGLTPLQALQTATIIPATVMNHAADSGTIAPGKRADLILVPGNPLADISTLRHVTTTITNGRAYTTKSLAQTVGFRR